MHQFDPCDGNLPYPPYGGHCISRILPCLYSRDQLLLRARRLRCVGVSEPVQLCLQRGHLPVYQRLDAGHLKAEAGVRLGLGGGKRVPAQTHIIICWGEDWVGAWEGLGQRELCQEASVRREALDGMGACVLGGSCLDAF